MLLIDTGPLFGRNTYWNFLPQLCTTHSAKPIVTKYCISSLEHFMPSSSVQIASSQTSSSSSLAYLLVANKWSSHSQNQFLNLEVLDFA
mmetsp:Transcript_18406/g.28857  ORF Transcript_18406/g.28857 Transcript_18406/m.28857 type:complete len:89 (-) Transcript_18406:222-488(-)